MGCLYYVPARRFEGSHVPDTLKGEALAAVGLGHLNGAVLSFRGVRNHGPDGGAGLVIGLKTPADKTGVLPGQCWKPANGGNLFLGWPEGAAPGPDTFLRKDPITASGELVLADGNPWGFTATKALPTVMGFDAAGEAVMLPRGRDAAIFEASRWLMQFAVEEEERSYLEIVERVGVCLGARYHVSALEVIALGLFSTDLLGRIVFAALGIEADAGKKNEDAAA